MTARRMIDLSHPISSGMVTYPGLPPPRISDHLTRADSAAHYSGGTTFHIARLEMVANTGTYLDAPSHRLEGGVDVAGLPLERLADLEGQRVGAGAERAIGPETFSGLAVRGCAVLVHTGWAQHFGTERYGHGHPYLTRSAAEALVSAGAALVGIDSLNIDDTNDGSRPAHTVLLGAGIPIVEHLRGLELLPASGFRFFAVPAPVRGMGSFPTRAFALI